MYQQQRKMAVGPETATTINSNEQYFKAAHKSKLATILKVFLSGQSLNRFDAERYHDHCLNSTVSSLQNHHGVLIKRQRETVPCLDGKATTSVNRYWLNPSPENISHAQNVLAILGSKL
jgi:hypothetical protein